MKQVVQNYKTGELKIEEVPAPKVKPGCILIKTESSFISIGTERTKIETARMNLFEKALSRLDLLKILISNIKQEGLIFTIKKAWNKLDMPISLGYSCAGKIMELGEGVRKFKVGERVACVGETYATHSELNIVPTKFAVSIKNNIDVTEASFVGIGAIALNSVELAQIQTNEIVVVIGLGLIGQMVTQILKTKGCKVIGIDVDETRILLAKEIGIDAAANPLYDEIEVMVNNFSSGKGADAVIITATSRNNLPIEIAGKISRVKGRVVLVGTMPIIIPRKNYYEKELYFMISRGFGSGLYYEEEKDRRYAYNYKPISIKENMENFLSLLEQKKVKVNPLISHRFSFSEANQAYELIRNRKEKYLGVIFEYDNNLIDNNYKKIVSLDEKKDTKQVNIGFVGAGSFAQGYLLPILKKHKEAQLIGVATTTGISANNVARKFGFQYCTTDYNEILNDDKIDTLFIVTRHNLHANLVIEALKRGKNTFVEKPLCLNEKELKEIITAYNSQTSKSMLMVGFNRRFSPFVKEVKNFFRNRTAPLMIHYRVNAGSLPSHHWVHNKSEGGGRIIGEICHFVDLLQYITNAAPIEIFANSIYQSDSMELQDNLSISIKFDDGSLGIIMYNSIGDTSYPRECIEIFGDNSVAVIDNFKKGVYSRSGISYKIQRLSQDMGHTTEIASFINGILKKEPTIIPFHQIILTTLSTFKIVESLKQKFPLKVDLERWQKENFIK